MIWAIQNNQRVTANPNQKAICPVCNAEVISKCGSIKVWHWSHISIEDCDTWSEGETEWHLKWKDEFPKEWQEYVIGKHRADIYSLHKLKVLELQNSAISKQDIILREQYYNNMVWLLNINNLWKGLVLRKKSDNLYTFRWRNPAKSWWSANKPIYLDLNELIVGYENTCQELFNKLQVKNLPSYLKDSYEKDYNYFSNKINEYQNKIFLVKKIYHNLPCGGYGILLTKEEFLKQFR